MSLAFARISEGAGTRLSRGRSHAIATVLLAAVAISAAGCVANDPPASPANPGTPPPILTAPGTPAGPEVGATLDGGGGTFASSDGQVMVTVPAGAIPANTTFSIQPITNPALGGVGAAYRLGPEGVSLQQPVTLVFRAPDSYAPGTGIDGLGIATQDASGFWMLVPDVRRDAVAKTLTVEATHFSDWGVIWASGIPNLYGTFSLTQTLGTIPFHASGTATLFFQGDSETRTLYVVTGTVSPDIDPPNVCSTVGPVERTLVPSIAEITSAPLGFRWGINADWDLTCTTPSPETNPDPFVAAVFDTLGLSMVGYVCTRGYVGTPSLGTDGVHGTYLIDCGLEGSALATWDFIACVPGVICSDPALNPCHDAAIVCTSGTPVCTDTGTNVADGTACGAGLLEQCQTGTCTCVPGAACPPVDACNTSAVTCGPTACTQTPIPPGVCTPTDACNTAAWSCDPVTGPACTQTPIPPGVCVPIDACNTAAWSCDPVTGPACTQTPIPPGVCDPIDECHTAAWSCDPGSGPACTQTPLDGTPCNAGAGVCTAGVCTP